MYSSFLEDISLIHSHSVSQSLSSQSDLGPSNLMV